MDIDWDKTTPPSKKIKCTAFDCENDLHSFKRVRPKKGENYRLDTCRECGVELFDWSRIDKKDLADVDYLINALKNEFVRHAYWVHNEIDSEARRKALKLGPEGIRAWAKNRLTRNIVPPKKDNGWDGRQTPYDGNIVFYAQHAIAVCCRTCIEEWYDIDRNSPISESELEYFLDLIMIYVQEKIPEIF